MKIDVLHEAGYEEALLGLSLSYNTANSYRDILDHLGLHAKVARKLAFKGDGHNKFLASIVVWLDVTAAREWWQQEATYCMGITRQSESTMHTILKRPLYNGDFEGGIQCKALLDQLNLHIRGGDWRWVKRHLPESFLQRRIVCVNYMTLQRMIRQRGNHKLPEWRVFIDGVLGQIEHSELLEAR